jgi:hypothetical protein
VIAAAKRHFLRGNLHQYIPGWKKILGWERLNSDHEKESIFVRLLEKLNEQRKSRWADTIEKTNFTRYSRKVWNLLKKLGTDYPQTVPPKTVSANSIASRLLCVSKAPMDKNDSRAPKSSLRGLKSILMTNLALSANFNINELLSVLKSVKLGTAAVSDGVYLHP